MKLTAVLMFGAGYVIGTRAGRERYAEIVMVVEKASKRIEEYSARDRAGDGEPDRGSRRRRAAV
jgi:hypothetical protein